MGDITPLLVDFWLWLCLAGVWLIAACFDGFIDFVIMTLSLVLKSRREETLLTNVFGEDYGRYKRETSALIPLGWLSPATNQPIQSDAFQQAVLRSDRYRIIGMLSVCGAFMILDIAMALASPPDVEGYDIAGWSQPAEETGGDYYDWLALPTGKILVTIADVTGHGIGPALLAASCRAGVRAIAQHDQPLELTMQQVDAQLAADVPQGRFITAALALLDPGAHELHLYSAGQAPLFLYNAAANKVTIFDADEPPLGLSLLNAGITSQARCIPLAPGDAVILITDGFFESTNPAGQMLGIASLADFIRTTRTDSAAQLIAQMRAHVQEFAQAQPQADDLTAVVIQRRALAWLPVTIR